MKRFCCLFVLLTLGALCFAQSQSEYAPFSSGNFLEPLDYSPRFDLSHPSLMASENEQTAQNTSIFANAPQWVKDLRRGEIVFFGTLPFTVFFTKTFIDLYRMGTHDWDQRYAPWPFQSAGGVPMDYTQRVLTFVIAGSVSLVIAVVDHLIVRYKRRAAAPLPSIGSSVEKSIEKSMEKIEEAEDIEEIDINETDI